MKKFLLITFCLVIALSNFTFAYNYKWQKNEAGEYSLILDEEGQPPLSFSENFYTENGATYYFDEQGKMCTGWYCIPGTEKIYFFNNNPSDKFYGQMATGFKTIDGYKRYFNEDGTFVKAAKENEKVPVLDSYEADYNGDIYQNGVLQVDRSTARSDFYTDVKFYEDATLNNSVVGTNIVTWKGAYDLAGRTGEVSAPVAH